METKRDEALAKLAQQVVVPPIDPSSTKTTTTTYQSWVRGPTPLPDPTIISSPSSYPTDRCRFFDQHGFVFLPNFASPDEVQSMKSTMAQLVQQEWKPGQGSNSTQVFRTDQKQIEAQGRSDYFLDSANKIHFFAEKDALYDDDDNDNNNDSNKEKNNNKKGKLKPEYQSNKIAALNKAGHGMHILPNAFQTYTQSPKIGSLLRELGWKDPIVPQSMYIFKQARIGGEVTSHQDSTFLYTTPRQTCIGLWLALDDATLDNGCLWVRPGSHGESVRRQFVRNPEHFGKNLDYTDDDEDGKRSRISCDENGVGDRTKPQMIFRDLSASSSSSSNISWEGKLPDKSLPIPECKGLYDAGFIPVPCKAGDLLAFCGELDHLSLPNFSDKARHTFQLHCVEGEGAGVTWSKENWLQYPKGVEFMKL